MSNDLATIEVPAFLKEASKSNRGSESEMDKKDQALPRLSLLHSAEDGFEAATFIHSITRTALSNPGGELVFIPIFIYYEYFKWKEKEDDGLEFKTIHRNDPRIQEGELEWEKKDGVNIQPRVETCIQCLVLLENVKEPIIISFRSSNYNFGKQLWNMIRMKQGDIFMNRFSVTPDGPHEGKKKKKYYKMATRYLGYVKEESDFKLAEQLYDQIVPGIKSGNTSGKEETGEPVDEPSI